MNDDILLTREQIGQALEYSNPIDAIYRIHKRHQDRLDKMSICISDGLGHDIYYYNEKRYYGKNCTPIGVQSTSQCHDSIKTFCFRLSPKWG